MNSAVDGKVSHPSPGVKSYPLFQPDLYTVGTSAWLFSTVGGQRGDGRNRYHIFSSPIRNACAGLCAVLKGLISRYSYRLPYCLLTPLATRSCILSDRNSLLTLRPSGTGFGSGGSWRKSTCLRIRRPQVLRPETVYVSGLVYV